MAHSLADHSLPGLGRARLAAVRAAGLLTIEDIAAADAVDGISAAVFARLRAAATTYLAEVGQEAPEPAGVAPSLEAEAPAPAAVEEAAPAPSAAAVEEPGAEPDEKTEADDKPEADEGRSSSKGAPAKARELVEAATAAVKQAREAAKKGKGDARKRARKALDDAETQLKALRKRLKKGVVDQAEWASISKVLKAFQKQASRLGREGKPSKKDLKAVRKAAKNAARGLDE